MSCVTVRDRLAEHALGVLPGPDAAHVDRHLTSCAACRREAEGLGRAAGSLPYALEQVEPPAELEARVLAAVRSAAADVTPHRGRPAVWVLIAAMLALSGLGWGAVMAGRASRLESRIERQGHQQTEAVVRIERIFSTLEFSDGWARVGVLSATDGGLGRGGAMTFTSESIRDIAIVDVLGLRPAGAPYTVELARRGGRALTLGRVRHLDADGGATIVRRFPDDLEGFARVVIRDAGGSVVLQGTLAAPTEVVSPSPAPHTGL